MIPQAFSIGLVGLSVNYTACYFLNEFKHEFYTLEIGIIIFNSAWCPAGRIDLLDKTSLLNKKPVESRHKAADARAESLEREGVGAGREAGPRNGGISKIDFLSRESISVLQLVLNPGYIKV